MPCWEGNAQLPSMGKTAQVSHATPANGRVFLLQDGLLRAQLSAAAEWESKCGTLQSHLADRQEADACQAEASAAEVTRS
jgi:hypothetical protein